MKAHGRMAIAVLGSTAALVAAGCSGTTEEAPTSTTTTETTTTTTMETTPMEPAPGVPPGEHPGEPGAPG
ncbi:MAG: hypothetical protein M3Y90_18010, partial [Actinomycetota bacterium]|nr:hypothetical protein [Actinomycetota bacterium]